ncbi:MAG TPA: DUF4249 domain-containing protein [Paludibacter sp.]|nr:DUF4249 domain-containing protein [Paludibacter sp.]
MKFNILHIFLSALLFSACTEDIKLDLNSSNPQVVIEGSVPVDGKARISITKSINFDTNNSFPTVSNAIVTLTDNIGNSEILTENAAGIYTSNSMVGIVGRTYSLSIKTDDKTITSACKIPDPVRFDSLAVKVAENFRGGPFGGNEAGTLYTVTAMYKDPASVANYYRFIEYINGKSTGNIYAYEDRFTNGKTAERNLLNFNRYLTKGDTITVEMQGIDRSVYEYFNSFGNLGMGPSSSTPANPYTNLNGAVLGYFSAYTTERKSFIIK